MAARQRGAKALLVVTGPRSPNAGELIPMTFDTALAGSGIVAASISGTTGTALLEPTGKTLEEVQRSFDSGNPHVAGFAIAGITEANVDEVLATGIRAIVRPLPGFRIQALSSIR